MGRRPAPINFVWIVSDSLMLQSVRSNPHGVVYRDGALFVLSV